MSGTWRNLGHDPKLCESALEHLKQIMERTQLFTEQPTATESTVRIATLPPLSVRMIGRLQNCQNHCHSDYMQLLDRLGKKSVFNPENIVRPVIFTVAIITLSSSFVTY